MSTALATRGNGDSLVRVVDLPDGGGKTLARLSDRGAVVRIEKSVELVPASKHVISVNRYENGQRTAITFVAAAGYFWLNRTASLHVHTPASVVVDGVAKLNPHVVIDDREQVKEVCVRKIAIGRAPNGNIVAVDTTHIYRPKQVLIRNLMKKWRGDWKAPPAEWGKLMSEAALTPEMKKAPYSMILPYALGTVLVVDISNRDVIGVLCDYNDVQFYAVRVASTVAERNVLKKHPALAVSTVTPDKDGKFIVPVTGWMEPDRSMPEMERLAQQIAMAGEPGGEDKPVPNGVEVKRSSEDISEDDTIDAETVAAAGDDGEREPEYDPSRIKGPETPEPEKPPAESQPTPPAETPPAQQPDKPPSQFPATDALFPPEKEPEPKREQRKYGQEDLPELRKRFEVVSRKMDKRAVSKILQSLGVRSVADLRHCDASVIGCCVETLEQELVVNELADKHG